MVNERSGCLDLPERIKKYPLAKTHFNMNKFSRPSEEDFLVVRDVIEEMVAHAHELIDLRNTTPSTLPVLPNRIDTVSSAMVFYPCCESANRISNSTKISARG